MRGKFSISRELLTHDLWLSEPFTRGQAWVDLIGLANYKPGWIRIRGIRIHLERGDVGWSKRELMRRWKWSQKKLNTFLQELENDERTEQKVMHRIYTIISIKKYDSFQHFNAQSDAQSNAQSDAQSNAQSDAQSNAQSDDEEEGNKDNKEKNDKKGDKRATPKLFDLISFWNTEHKTKYRPNPLLEENFNFWIKVYTFNQMKVAVLSYPFHKYWSKGMTPNDLLQTNSFKSTHDRIGELLSFPTQSQQVIEYRQALARKESNE